MMVTLGAASYGDRASVSAPVCPDERVVGGGELTSPRRVFATTLPRQHVIESLSTSFSRASHQVTTIHLAELETELEESYALDQYTRLAEDRSQQ